MRAHPLFRRFTLLFVAALALTVALVSRSSWASSAELSIYSDLNAASCAQTGTSAPAVYQGGRFQVKLDQYWDELVAVDITFPDGRVFSVIASRQLDGVIDQPDNILSLAPANEAGEVSGVMTVPGAWPYGCYRFTGRGLSSGKAASAMFVVVPGGGPAANPGPATFSVTRSGNNSIAATQGSLVDLNGHGFRAGEVISLWITAPDGTVIDFPNLDANGNPMGSVISDNSGDFQAAFRFTGKNPVGTYQFTALGTLSGYRLIAPFTLDSPPVVERGWAELRVAYPSDQRDPQRSGFEVQGQLFTPYERVDVWMTLPDGSVRGLPSQYADQVGDFYALLYLDERLPTGFYQFTAKGSQSGALVITSLTLDQNSGTRFNAVPGPEVLDSNSGAEGPAPETTNPFEEGNPGPRVN
jgi:hypothetical protein